VKAGDLVKFRHFPQEGGIVIKVYTRPGEDCPTIDILSHCGTILVARDPEAFEVISESW